MIEYIILSKLMKENREKELVLLLKRIVIETNSFKKDYPDYENWFWEKHVIGIFEGNRDTIIAIKNNKIIGISNIKNTPLERKICTLSVDRRYRMRSIGSKLIEISLKLLQTKTPIITMSLYKLPEFYSIIRKNNWIVTSCKKNFYKEGVYEVFFNDYEIENNEVDEKMLIKGLNYNIYKIFCFYLLKKYSKCSKYFKVYGNQNDFCRMKS